MKGIQIGQYTIDLPIVQGGMGLGISWDQLAGTVSSLGGLGTISSVGTGYYQEGRFSKKLVKGRPFETENLYNAEALKEIFKNARKICGDKPLACNILRAINDYDRVVGDAIAAGANIIVTGAGLPLGLATLVKDHPEVEIVPIVSSDRALKIICNRWERAGRLPGAVIVEGPKSGGHQGAKMEELELPEHQLEAILPAIVEERNKWGDFPIIVAGGIWDNADIERFLAMGADAVQLGTRFAATFESDATQGFKDVLLGATQDDIVYVKSPVGYPGRAVKTTLTANLQPNPKIQCISNCVQPCGKAKGARQVGFCIADSLADARAGLYDTGLFFTGANGYRVDRLYHVAELIDELMGK